MSVFFAELFAEHDNPPRNRLDFVAAVLAYCLFISFRVFFSSARKLPNREYNRA